MESVELFHVLRFVNRVTIRLQTNGRAPFSHMIGAGFIVSGDIGVNGVGAVPFSPSLDMQGRVPLLLMVAEVRALSTAAELS